ncbi:MAG: molecular chaperone HscC [Haemophilus pittmaniae]|uniref:molecular chaperone HscC n=1 Tax=Haemophilus pittmaniae TaxID=249188 RepID=UPI0023F249F4|nr:molecular chaperone HscC [Haemophilus pittmaniae]MBS6026851.1 molecular chaperone HscC [Haemophilus pittmaniae]
MSLQIGIDLGTTNSLIAQFIDGETRLIPNKLGHGLTPSVVSVSEDGSILVGLAARERLATAPHMTASAFKRFMGSDKIFKLGKQQFRAEELSALVLKSLKEDAEHFLGEPIEEVVITVPAYFNAIQRQATKNAAEMAGLKVSRLLNEPTAAGLAYNLQDKPDDTNFLIFDLGGGTFDVSILDYFDGVVQVSASAGDNKLGGEDFVQVLQHYFLTQCSTLSNAQKQRIQTSSECWQVFEHAKRQLSKEKSVKIALTLDEQVHEAIISEEDFRQAAQPLIARLRQPIERALRDAKLNPASIDGIILVGGSTRMPIIRKAIAQWFQRLPLSVINPDEAIARGAAVQAALIARNQNLEEVVLTDVMPFSLGTTVGVDMPNGQRVNDRFSPIIERNMPVPISREEHYVTSQDNQTKLHFDIRQGESAISSENILLGEMFVTVPPRPKGEVGITVRFSYDINGLLEVDLTNDELDIQVNQVFQHNSHNLSEAEVQASREKLAKLKIHPRDQQENRYLLEKAKRLYENYLGEDRATISEFLAYFETELESQDEGRIHRARKKMQECLARYDTGWLL